MPVSEISANPASLHLQNFHCRNILNWVGNNYVVMRSRICVTMHVSENVKSRIIQRKESWNNQSCCHLLAVRDICYDVRLDRALSKYGVAITECLHCTAAGEIHCRQHTFPVSPRSQSMPQYSSSIHHYLGQKFLFVS
jgi:hypothetical protein